MQEKYKVLVKVNLILLRIPCIKKQQHPNSVRYCDILLKIICKKKHNVGYFQPQFVL